MTIVKARPNESIDQLLKRFKKAVDNSGVLSELRKREYYEKPSVKRKKKQAAARKRFLKKMKKFRPKPKASNWKWNKDHTKKIPLKTYSNNTGNKPKFNKPRSDNPTANRPYRSKPRHQNQNKKGNER